LPGKEHRGEALKLSSLAFAAAGYVLGSRAGRERYEQIVRLARRVAGSQTVQSTAGLVQAQLDEFAAHARHALAAKLGGAPRHSAEVNGYHH
jgi:hypothetical protein